MNAAIKNLSVEEKIILVEELWEDIEKERSIGLTKAQKELLDERMRLHLMNPNEGISLEQFREKYLS
jgi:putative addiction module component (TIGR02574 family)